MSYKLLIAFVLVAVTGCTTPNQKTDGSARLIRERYQPSADSFEFGCAFAFQSHLDDYVKNEINGSWLPGTCIVDSERSVLLVGHEGRDQSGNTSTGFVTSITFKSLDSAVFKLQRGYVQFQLGSKDLLAGQWSGVTYPKSRLILNTSTKNLQTLNERLLKSGLPIRESAVEIKQKYKEPEANFDWIYTLPRPTR